MVQLYNVVLILILFITAIYCFLNNEKYRTHFFVLFVLILGSMSAFRFETFYGDFLRYTYHVIEAYKMPWKDVFLQDEFLNGVYQKLIIILFKDPQFYFITSGFFIAFAFLYIGHKLSCNICVYTFLFYTTFTYFVMHNITRQGIATGILCFSAYYLIKNKPQKSLILFFIAFFFHTSSIVFAVIYLLRFIPINKKTFFVYGILFFCLSCFYPFFIDVVQMFIYESYDDNSFGMKPAKIYNLVTIFPVIHAIAFLYHENNKKTFFVLEENINRAVINMLIHGSCLYCIFVSMCCICAGIFMRVANVFVIFPLLCISVSLKKIHHFKKLYFIFVLYLIGISIFIISNMNAKLFPSPYNFFWEVENRPVLVKQ